MAVILIALLVRKPWISKLMTMSCVQKWRSKNVGNGGWIDLNIILAYPSYRPWHMSN